MKISANGIQVNYTLEGPADGPMVTMSHSLATDLSMWDPQAKALAGRYRVLRYDTRGHGGTDAPAGAYTLTVIGINWGGPSGFTVILTPSPGAPITITGGTGLPTGGTWSHAVAITV